MVWSEQIRPIWIPGWPVAVFAMERHLFTFFFEGAQTGETIFRIYLSHASFHSRSGFDPLSRDHDPCFYKRYPRAGRVSLDQHELPVWIPTCSHHSSIRRQFLWRGPSQHTRRRNHFQDDSLGPTDGVVCIPDSAWHRVFPQRLRFQLDCGRQRWPALRHGRDWRSYFRQLGNAVANP